MPDQQPPEAKPYNRQRNMSLQERWALGNLVAFLILSAVSALDLGGTYTFANGTHKGNFFVGAVGFVVHLATIGACQGIALRGRLRDFAIWKWIAATAFGFSVPFIILLQLRESTGNSSELVMNLGYLLSLVIGSALQSAVLQPYFVKSWLWIAASSLGMAIGSIIAGFVMMFFLEADGWTVNIFPCVVANDMWVHSIVWFACYVGTTSYFLSSSNRKD